MQSIMFRYRGYQVVLFSSRTENSTKIIVFNDDVCRAVQTIPTANIAIAANKAQKFLDWVA